MSQNDLVLSHSAMIRHDGPIIEDSNVLLGVAHEDMEGQERLGKNGGNVLGRGHIVRPHSSAPAYNEILPICVIAGFHCSCFFLYFFELSL